MEEVKGILIPIGGNEDKGIDNKVDFDFITEGILSHILKEAGGIHSNILIIPTASGIPDEVAENYMKAFNMLNCDCVSVLDIRNEVQCNSPAFLNKLKTADGVLFSGGDQSKIVDIIGGTLFHDLLLSRFINETFVIAGTSAGAMAMVAEMIMGGSSEESMVKGAVKMREGLHLINDLIIDTHFIRRGRFGRLSEAVARFPDKIGIGLAEDTGIIIKNRNEFKVIGSGMVILLDPNNLTHNNHSLLKEGTPMSISNLTTHILANGDRFRLSDRSVSVLPIEEPFDQ
jgi:cyanophycinase